MEEECLQRGGVCVCEERRGGVKIPMCEGIIAHAFQATMEVGRKRRRRRREGGRKRRTINPHYFSQRSHLKVERERERGRKGEKYLKAGVS